MGTSQRRCSPRGLGDPNARYPGPLARGLLSLHVNTVEPAQYVGNKAAGILFENKIDHQTYFCGSIECVQGIHMIPILPHLSYTRSARFVQEEWDAYFESTIEIFNSGFRGILVVNHAISDPAASYAFFSNATGQWDPVFLDDGASRTWYLAYSAAMGGALANSSD